MSNRNSDRLEMDQTPQVTDDAPVVEQRSNISYFSPTEMVELPTKGMFYPKEHILHNVHCIEMKYVGTKQIEMLNSKTLLQKGVALDKVLKSLMVNEKINVDDLYIGDKNALVLYARISGFGAEYKTKVTCTSCTEKVDFEFDLNEVKPKELDDKEISEGGTFDLTLPKSKVVVECKLLTGKDEKSLKMISDKKKRHNLPETPIADQLEQIIISVNGDSDKEVIHNFVENMTGLDNNYIRSEYAKKTPNIDLKQNIECPSCNTSIQLSIPFTADFFWPNRT